MTCDWPLKCRWWKEGRCTFDFDNWDGKGEHPCSLHQARLDRLRLREMEKVLRQMPRECLPDVEGWWL